MADIRVINRQAVDKELTWEACKNDEKCTKEEIKTRFDTIGALIQTFKNVISGGKVREVSNNCNQAIDLASGIRNIKPGDLKQRTQATKDAYVALEQCRQDVYNLPDQNGVKPVEKEVPAKAAVAKSDVLLTPGTIWLAFYDAIGAFGPKAAAKLQATNGVDMKNYAASVAFLKRRAGEVILSDAYKALVADSQVKKNIDDLIAIIKTLPDKVEDYKSWVKGKATALKNDGTKDVGKYAGAVDSLIGAASAPKATVDVVIGYANQLYARVTDENVETRLTKVEEKVVKVEEKVVKVEEKVVKVEADVADVGKKVEGKVDKAVPFDAVAELDKYFNGESKEFPTVSGFFAYVAKLVLDAYLVSIGKEVTKENEGLYIQKLKNSYIGWEFSKKEMPGSAALKEYAEQRRALVDFVNVVKNEENSNAENKKVLISTLDAIMKKIPESEDGVGGFASLMLKTWKFWCGVEKNKEACDKAEVPKE